MGPKRAPSLKVFTGQRLTNVLKVTSIMRRALPPRPIRRRHEAHMQLIEGLVRRQIKKKRYLNIFFISGIRHLRRTENLLSGGRFFRSHALWHHQARGLRFRASIHQVDSQYNHVIPTYPQKSVLGRKYFVMLIKVRSNRRQKKLRTGKHGKTIIRIHDFLCSVKASDVD